MLDYFFFMFCFLSFYNLKLKGLDNFFFDYIKLDNTNSIKGIFVWIIIFSHKTTYGNYKKYIYYKILVNLRQKVVSMFLFYSGFGILESFKKKGINYVRTLPLKAFIIFIKSQLILLLYLFVNIFIFKYKITLKQYFLSIIFKSSLGNSNWFAFTIIVFYFYSYISFRFINKRIILGIIIISFLCYLHCIFVYNFYFPNHFYPIDTVLCFLFGFYYSFIYVYSDKIIMKNDIYYFMCISIVIFFYYKTFMINNFISISLKNALFSIIIVLISMKVQFNNNFLKFLNSHSYSIYLLQRLVMLIVYKIQVFRKSDFIQISFEFALIFFIASCFDKHTSFIDKLIKNKQIYINLKSHYTI